MTDEIKKKSGTISNSISHSISNTIDICLEDIKCKTYANNNCNCIQCFDGYYVDNYKCIKCKELCQDYEENTCICNNNTNEYLFYGYYNELKDEKIFLLKTNNLTDVENTILHKVRDKIKNGEINYQLIDNGNYFFVEINNAKFMFANEKDKNKNILANIDLGECKEKINENKNNSLYMFYIQVSEEGMNFPKTEYEIYSKSEDSNIEKIDLEKCKDIKISKEVSINITNENIDKYNSSSAYYNDICYTTTSETGTDITLADRRNEYISNYAICQDNCEFISYDEDNGKAICSCSISTSFSSISDIKFDKDKIKSNFINFKNIANINILKCYKVVFNKQILKNIGCIIVSLILFFEIISVFVFYGYEYNLVKNKIKVIMEAKEWENKQIKLENNNTAKNKRGSKKSLKIINDDKDKGNNISRKSKNEIQIFDKRGSKIKRKSTRKSKFKNIQAPPKSNSNNKINIKNKTSINDKKTSAIFIKNKSINSFEFLTLNNQYLNNEKKEEIYNKTLKHSDSELNLLSYNEALQSDKRTYCQYTSSLIKTRHLLIFSFCNNNDYNSLLIKINLFLITFTINLAVNALFFNDSTMHKIYEDEGKFNFLYQIPQILYSTLISSLLIIIIKVFALSEKNIIKIKNSKYEELIKVKNKEVNSINCKFILFFIVIIIFTGFFWYYVGCFCGVYKNTQIHLINDTLISFFVSLLYPFVIYLIPGIFRIPSLKSKEKKEDFLYNLSKIIQLIT